MQLEPPLNINKKIQLIREFNAAPDESWFGQQTVAVLRDCSEATIERDRWLGIGIPFVKCGRSVRYSKANILAWLSKHVSVQSTTQAQLQVKEQAC